MAEITRQEIEDLPTPSSHAPSITNVKHLSSYNWIEAPTPTIAVPGSPALWSPPSAPRQLQKDSGFLYIGQNAARHPDSPLEPLFRALHITNPSFNLKTIDVVTDRNNIRKLLSFVSPGTNIHGTDPFTITIEFVKDTAIFCRDETKTYEIIGPNEFRGFGHNFEKVYTKDQLNGSTGHHRIITYRFGGLNFIVRHETDGYLAKPTQSYNKSGGDILSDALQSLSLTRTPAKPVAGSKLSIRREGETVPLGSTLEIKTRVAHRLLNIQDVAPQLWLSQTPNLVRAYHNRGLFPVPAVEDVAEDIDFWEERNNRDLAKLAALVHRILSLAKKIGGSVVVKYDGFGDKLQLSKISRKKMLPEDIYSLWDDAKVSQNPDFESFTDTVDKVTPAKTFPGTEKEVKKK
ncbi:hypothetical protein B0T11DRAFT_341481 [Plectosphaerella cucumerina]|uniref:Geranylgeranyl pyrophosphate synthetase n=1 Tax=Plectosphaerella cucumerina TaxID=40658 RepID=A0A8K0TIW1_9PEZI|nr:hypothetical protein B0T11DRAFT_341481 [Plectosphaerella cucumerina]